MSHPLTWLDVFTAVPLRGNGLAVVHDADDLDDATMLAYARETQLSETTFVQSGRDGADYVNRIFTTAGEIDFAGHPSLGTAVAIALQEGRTEASYVQQTHAGRQPIDVTLDGRQATAAMLQRTAIFGATAPATVVAAAAGLTSVDMHPTLPCQVVSTGQPHLIAPVASAEVLDRARPASARMRPLMSLVGAMVLYLVALDPDAPRADARGFFLAERGVIEDPATGSAAGPLGAYAHARLGQPSTTITQGALMGRPSQLEATVVGGGIRVAGAVVVVSTGTLLV